VPPCVQADFTGCGKTLSPEGDGLQPVRNYFEINVALAPEGTTLSKQRLFPHLLHLGRNGWKRNWALHAACEPERKPQISPLRFAPVEMTNLLHGNCQLSSGCTPVRRSTNSSSRPKRTQISCLVVGTEPLMNLVLGASIPWAVPLYDKAVDLIKNSEIASAVATNGASGTGLAKAAVVATQFEPFVLELLKGKGVVSPTRTQIERYVAGAVETLDAFEAMVTPVPQAA
jgi:hypothetical protein